MQYGIICVHYVQQIILITTCNSKHEDRRDCFATPLVENKWS